MASFHLARPESMPLDRLFPEAFEASKREIIRDFVFFGSAIAGTIILGALVNATLL